MVEQDDPHRLRFGIRSGHLQLCLLFLDVSSDLGAECLSALVCQAAWAVLHEQSLNSVFLNQDIHTCLSDAHYKCLHHSVFFGLVLEELECVELHARLRGELSHSILAIHLITLFGHFEFVGHVI